MPKAQSSGFASAGLLLCSILFAATPTFAQTTHRSAEPPTSVVSLVPSPKPEGAFLARRPGDATFSDAPANYHVFAAATVGEEAGAEELTINFAAPAQLTAIRSKNHDFVLEGGSCHEGDYYEKGDSCTLLVRFDPQGAGHRLGFISIGNTAEAAPMQVGLLGNGYAPAVSFIPSLITTVPATLSGGVGVIKSSTNIAVDGGDIVYIADTGNAEVREVDSSGILKTLPVLISSTTPVSIAVDNLGIIYTLDTPSSTFYFDYYTPWESQTAWGPTYVPGSCTPSSPCYLGTVGLGNPANLGIDANDNLFLEEKTEGAAEMPVSDISGGGSAQNVWYLTDPYAYSPGPGAESFAVDAQDNLYTAYLPAYACMIFVEPLYNAEYSPLADRVAGASNCGFSGDGGQARNAEISGNIGQIAFDAAGNLYFADIGNQRVRRIDYDTGIIHTIAGTGTQGYTGNGGEATLAELSNPSGVGVDSQGQVYILQNVPSAGPTQALRQVTLTGLLSFGSVVTGTASPAKVVEVSNTGNSELQLSSAAFINGADPADYSIDPNTTTCALTVGATLAAGESCNVGVIFKPKASGTRSANLVFADNTVTGQNVVELSGTGLLTPTIKITAPASGASENTGATVTFSVSVTGTPVPTGTVTFSVNGKTIGSAVTLSTTGTASTTFTEASAGTYTLKAVYSGSSTYVSATVTETITEVVPDIRKGTKAILTP